MESILSVLFFLLCQLSGVFSVTCTKDTFGYTSYITCAYRCCGTRYSRYCCGYSTYTTSSRTYISGGATAGIVISILIFFAIVLTLSMCYKKKYYGRVLRTGAVGHHAAVTVHTTTVSSVQQPYPMYNQSYQPGAMQPRMQTSTHVTQAAPMHPGYVPAPPAYSNPPPGYSQPMMQPMAPPPPYSQKF